MPEISRFFGIIITMNDNDHAPPHFHARYGERLIDVVKVEPRGRYRIWLQFQDGVQGEIDLELRLSFEGVFAPLRDPEYFARVRVHPDLGTVCWPNDADWDPLVLYSLVTGRSIESLLGKTGPSGG